MTELDNQLYKHKGIRILVLILSIAFFIFLSTKIHEYFHWAYAYYKGYEATVQYGDLFGLKGWCYNVLEDRIEYYIGGLGTFAVMILAWFLIWIYPTDNTVPLELGALIVAFSNLFYGIVEGLYLGINDDLYYRFKYPAYLLGAFLATSLYWKKVKLFVVIGFVKLKR